MNNSNDNTNKIKSKPKDIRTRNWTFILYPESAPNNWKAQINKLNIPWIESPLHEGEVNPDNESEKKSHHHILLLFDGVKTYDQVKNITMELNSSIPQICHNAKGLVRYMIHLDNPEKKQYNQSDIIGHGGADPAIYLKATGAARYELIREMQKWVRENNCKEFFNLFDYAAENRFDDWFHLLCDNSAYILGEYIKSRRNFSNQVRPAKDEVTGNIVDLQTGEIIKEGQKNETGVENA
jgi:hypothetical protein